jgi:TnpA family transposase
MVQGVSYRQIQRITDWQMTEDNQRSALASLVNAIADLDTSQTWGQGKTSAKGESKDRAKFQTSPLTQYP